MINEDLRRWFKEKWVDISKKTKGGKHPPCGRSKATDAKYPKCRPSVRVSSETPQTSGEMTQKDKKRAVRQKRSAEAKVSTTTQGRKPVMTSHKNLKEETQSVVDQIINFMKPKKQINENNFCSLEKEKTTEITDSCFNKKCIVQFINEFNDMSHIKGIAKMASNVNHKKGYDIEFVTETNTIPLKLDQIINLKYIDNGTITEFKVLNESKNKPTNPKLWSRAKSLAKKKFKVYPSAYANGWASKWYKKHGGGWTTVNEEVSLKDTISESKFTKLKQKMKKLIQKDISEEIVNAGNAGTMTKKEIKSRDRIAKKVKAKPIKPGDSEKNAKYRLATYIELRKRGKEPKGKNKK